MPEPRPDWFGSVSLQAVWVVLLEKFIGPYAAEENKTILLAVVNNLEIEELVEVQQPGDHLDDKWTECNGNGLNLLGKMLTQLVLAVRTKDVQKAHRMLEWNAEFEAELRRTIGVDLYLPLLSSSCLIQPDASIRHIRFMGQSAPVCILVVYKV